MELRIHQNFPPRMRSAQYDSIVPVSGGLQFLDMCLHDVVKRLCHHAFMDGLVYFSGLTDGSASRLPTSKDPKTDNRVFSHVSVSCTRRILDALLESGELHTDNILSFSDGTSSISVETG